MIVLDVRNPDIFKLEEFNKWYDLSHAINKIEGIQEVVSISRVVVIEKDTVAHQFTFRPLVSQRPETQKKLTAFARNFSNCHFTVDYFITPTRMII